LGQLQQGNQLILQNRKQLLLEDVTELRQLLS
jgi:hypothetical protein